MAQIVEGDSGQPGLPEKWIEGTAKQILPAQWAAVRIGKHVEGTGESAGEQTLTMSAQRVHGEGGDLYRSSA